jgi:hypothetical protein
MVFKFRYCKLKTELQRLKKGWKRSGDYQLVGVLEDLALGTYTRGSADHHHLPCPPIEPKQRREGLTPITINPRSSSSNRRGARG